MPKQIDTTFPTIVWAFHPREGIPIFRLFDNRLIQRLDEQPKGVTECCYTWACETWSQVAYVGTEPAVSTQERAGLFYQPDWQSDVFKLRYIQIDPRAFGTTAENDWSFYTLWQLSRTALYQKIDHGLLGEIQLVRLFPSARIANRLAQLGI